MNVRPRRLELGSSHPGSFQIGSVGVMNETVADRVDQDGFAEIALCQ